MVVKALIVGREGVTSVLFALRATRVSEHAFTTQRLISGFFLVLLIACGGELTVEQQIIGVIRAMEAHAEAGERRPFMGYVAEGFQGQQGRMGRDDFRAFFALQLNRFNRLEAVLMPITVIDLGDGLAAAEFNALVTGGNRNLLPEAGQLYTISTTWLREGGDWLLNSADWTPVYPSP